MTRGGPLEGWLPGPLARRPRAVVLAVAAGALLWRLGAYGLWESTEARYAEVAAAMVRSGDWWVPRLNGLVHLDKPPFAYWATAAGLAVAGIDAFGARLGLVAASLGTLAIVFRWAEEKAGPTAGVAATTALLTMPLFFALSRSVSTDAYLVLWTVAAADAARRGTRPGAPRGWRILAWAALGAAFLTKGPVALVWTVLPALAWATATRGWGRLRRLADPWGVAVALAIALPWFLDLARRYPGAAGYWLGGQTAGRIAAPYEGESDPWWTYLPVLAWAAGPWAVPAAAGLASQRGAASRDRALLAAWILLPLLLFSAFPTKRANYLLPALPAVALAAGAWWAAAPRPRAVLRGVAAVGGGVGAALLAASALPAVRALPGPLPALGLLLGPAFLLGGAAAWLAAGRGARVAALAGIAVPLLGLYLALYAALARPVVEAWGKISRPLAVAAAEHRVADEPVIAWRDWPRAFPFYLGERIVTVGSGARGRVFEPDEGWRAWIRPEGEIGALWRAPRRVLVFLPRSRLDDLAGIVGEPPTLLARTRRWALVTNRPTPAEAAASGGPAADRPGLSAEPGPTARPPSGAAGSGPSVP